MSPSANVVTPLIETVGIGKSYGQHRVLQNVTFRLHPGEAVAVIGENGAGKSTFVKILAGAIRQDSGELRLGRTPVSFHSPRDALRHGIAFIPQELAYVPQLSVAENILLGRWPQRAGMLTPGMLVRRAQEEVARFGLTIDVVRPMSSLKLADLQLVEIVKALARRAKIILLDEPTASLTEAESGLLIGVLRRLLQEGVGIVYISHHMDEVFRFSDRVDVFRNGELVASERPSETNHNALITHMLGQAEEQFDPLPPQIVTRPPILELTGWSTEGVSSLRDVSLVVRPGEIVGLFGIRGSGTDLIAEGLVGRRADISGRLAVGGCIFGMFKRPIEARRAGIAYVPAERKKDGLILGLSIRNNLSLLVLHMLARSGVIDLTDERELAEALIARFNVRCLSQMQPVQQLSGGNQQKVLLASRLAAEPQLLLLNEPSRGVDVGARLEIHKFLRTIAAQDRAILLITSDIEEAVVVSDRLLIFRDGRIVDELIGARKTQGQALRGATGASIDEQAINDGANFS